MLVMFIMKMILTHFRSMFLPYGNQAFEFVFKPVDWFLQKANIGLERVKNMLTLYEIQASCYSFVMV